MRNIILAVLVALPLAASANEPFTLVSVDEVSRLVGRAGVYAFDANSADVYAKGHIPGAKLIHYSDFQAAELPADHQATLVFYCKNPH